MSSKGKVRADTGEATPVESDENYPTPAWCVHRLLDDVELPVGRWLEPCAGDGAIVRAVNSYFGDMETTRSHGRLPEWGLCEIRPECQADLAPLSQDVFIGDFQKFLPAALEKRVQGRWLFDVVITNPPYSLAAEFIEGCRKLAPLVAMLLRINYLASEKRAELHRRCLPEQTWILPNRPSFKEVVRDAYACKPCKAALTVDEGGPAPSCPKCGALMLFKGQRRSSSDSTEYAWMIWTPQSGPASTTRVLGVTPLEKRKRPRRALNGGRALEVSP